MLNTIQQTRNIVIKHAMNKVLAGELEIDQGLRLIAALGDEYEIMCDSLKRWERTCFMITDNRTVIIGGVPP